MISLGAPYLGNNLLSRIAGHTRQNFHIYYEQHGGDSIILSGTSLVFATPFAN